MGAPSRIGAEGAPPALTISTAGAAREGCRHPAEVEWISNWNSPTVESAVSFCLESAAAERLAVDSEIGVTEGNNV